jgi:Flp pilus assembly protein TadG
MRSRRNSTAGTATIELALSTLLLASLLGGAFRLGYTIYIYEALVNQVSAAARYASRVDFDTGHSFVPTVQNMAVYGTPTAGIAPMVPGLATSNINVTWATDSMGFPQTITVSITNFSVDAVFQTFTFSGKPAVTVRFAGRNVT